MRPGGRAVVVLPESGRVKSRVEREKSGLRHSVASCAWLLLHNLPDPASITSVY